MATDSYAHEDDEFVDDADLGPGGEEEPVSDEQRARAMGWKPLDEYRGDPRKWTDYPEFIRKGEEELPVLRDNNRRMSDRLARLEPEVTNLRTTVADQKTAIDAAVALAKRADDRGYQRALQELKDRQKAAVREGDEEAFDEVQAEIEAMETTRAEIEVPATPAPPAPAPPAAPGADPAVVAFVNKHTAWFNDATRPYLRTQMIALHNVEIQQDPSLPVAEQLENAYARLQAAFPELAPEGDDDVADPAPPARPRRQASVLPPSRPQPPRRPGVGSPIDRIADPAERAEARKAFESIKRHDPGMTEGEYMKIYDDPRIDAVALVQQRKK